LLVEVLGHKVSLFGIYTSVDFTWN